MRSGRPEPESRKVRKRKLTTICLRTVLLLVFQQMGNYPRPGQRAEEKLRSMGPNLRIPAADPRKTFQPRLMIPNLDATWPHGVRLLVRIWVVRSGPHAGRRCGGDQALQGVGSPPSGLTGGAQVRIGASLSGLPRRVCFHCPSGMEVATPIRRMAPFVFRQQLDRSSAILTRRKGGPPRTGSRAP
jgi:hypothetical protein